MLSLAKLGLRVSNEKGLLNGVLITVLGGSWDLVSKVISTLNEVISIVTLIITLVTKSHDPSSSPSCRDRAQG